eukprot:296507-Rhodomonas_salina.1
MMCGSPISRALLLVWPGRRTQHLASSACRPTPEEELRLIRSLRTKKLSPVLQNRKRFLVAVTGSDQCQLQVDYDPPADGGVCFDTVIDKSCVGGGSMLDDLKGSTMA